MGGGGGVTETSSLLMLAIYIFTWPINFALSSVRFVYKQLIAETWVPNLKHGPHQVQPLQTAPSERWSHGDAYSKGRKYRDA
jgi:hypothetical protein